MAERRMFAKTIVGSDAFTEMPLSSQALYFQICMEADDDGFVNNPNKIRKMIGASEDDLKILLAKRFFLTFDSGIIVVKHWRMNNYIRTDRYKPTIYQNEMQQLHIKSDGNYTERLPLGIPNDNQVTTNGIPSIGKDSIGKVSIGKDNIGKDNILTTTTTDHAGAGAPTREDSTQSQPENLYEVMTYFSECGFSAVTARAEAEKFFAYNEALGWKFDEWHKAADLWASRIREEDQQ